MEAVGDGEVGTGEILFAAGAGVAMAASYAAGVSLTRGGLLAVSAIAAICGLELNAERGGSLTPLWKGYSACVWQGVQLLRSGGWTNVASMFGGLCGEPVSALQLGFPVNWQESYPAWGINPRELSEEQQRQDPILLLIGKTADPGLMFGVAKVLAEAPETQGRPLFFCDWGRWAVNGAAQQAVWNRMEEIEKLYPREVSWTLVGHSWGAWAAAVAGIEGIPVDEEGPRFAAATSLSLRSNVGRLVLMGHPLTAEVDPDKMSKELLNGLYEIDAAWDLLVDQRSNHPEAGHKFEFSCGHIGLIHLPMAMGQVPIFASRSQAAESQGRQSTQDGRPPST